MSLMIDDQASLIPSEHAQNNGFKHPVEKSIHDTSEHPPEKKARVNGSPCQPQSDKNGNTTIDVKPTKLETHSSNVENQNVTKKELSKESNSSNKVKSQNNQTFLNHHSKDHMLKSAQKNGQVILKSPKKRLSDLMYIEFYENGGGYILHAYQDELARLEKSDLDAFVMKYYKTLFTERTKKNIPVEFGNYCIGIIHGAAEPLPDLLHYMAQNYPHLTVKSNAMEAKNDMISLTMKDYASNVYNSYSFGVYRYGPLHAISIVGTKGEETGTYCSDVIKMLEKNPFLRVLLPWGELSHLKGMKAKTSDDGPILWTRPGEQCVPTKSTPMKRKSKMNLDGAGMVGNLPMFGRGAIQRSTFIPDRTPCHADHADDGLLRHTTAAVGVLKAVHPKGKKGCNAGRRIVKDAVLFDPRHYMHLIARLQLDIMEPPASQCGNYWAEDAELNQLRVEGFTYVRVHLRDDDIYFIPRNTVHQFKTVSAVTSIAWHVRLKSYYKDEQPDSAPVPPDNNSSTCQPTETSTIEAATALNSLTNANSLTESAALKDNDDSNNVENKSASIHSIEEESASHIPLQQSEPGTVASTTADT